MEAFIVNTLQANLSIFRHFGYLIVFLVSSLESVPLLGMVIPGQTIVILSGFVVRLHFLGFWWAMCVAAMGAFLGDLLGFLLGRRYGHHLHKAEKKFFIKHEQFVKTKEVILEHPIKSLLFGRLHSLTRTLTPFVAGASEVSLSRFLIIETFGSLLWAFLSLGVGYVFGRSFEKASSFIGVFVFVATLIVVGVLGIRYYAKKKNIKISRSSFYVMIGAPVSLYVFWLIANNLRSGVLLYLFDHRMYALVFGLRTVGLEKFFLGFTFFVNFLFAPALFVFVLWWLILNKRIRDTFLFLLSLVSGLAIIDFVKFYFALARPAGLFNAFGSSFPSGHAMFGALGAVLISYLFVRGMHRGKRKTRLQIILVASVLLIGFSRIYVGVHWVSDVVAGICLGVFWGSFMIGLFHLVEFIRKNIKRKHEFPLP